MAYCVHCGVKLGESEKKCPLCHTPALDPHAPPDPAAPRAYPIRTPEQELKRSKKLLLFLCILLFLIPSALCLIIDWLTGGGLSWSIYPCGALVMFFICTIVPIYLPRNKGYAFLAISFITLSAYLLMVEWVSQSGRWFFPIVFPSLLLAFIIIALMTLFYRLGRLNKLTVLAAFFAAVGMECMAVELFCRLAASLPLTFQWAIFVAAPCIFLSLALFYINSNRAIREELVRRLHY